MLTVRPATKDDAEFLFQLRNQTSNRMMFKDTSLVVWENHVKWFLNRLERNDVHIFIGENESHVSVGQFRIDPDFKVSVSIDDSFKGKGYGVELIRKGSLEFRKKNNNFLIAEVKEQNAASLKSFEKAGYKKNESFLEDGELYSRFIFS